MATFLSRSLGNPSRSRIQAAKSVKTAKLSANPATIANGRRRPPVADPASTIGRTGSTHGDTAVITPARKPMPTRTAIARRQGYAGNGYGRLNESGFRGLRQLGRLAAVRLLLGRRGRLLRRRRRRRRPPTRAALPPAPLPPSLRRGQLRRRQVVGERARHFRKRSDALACRVEQPVRARRIP